MIRFLFKHMEEKVERVAFQNICKVLRYFLLFETKEIVLNCYVIWVLLYGIGCWNSWGRDLRQSKGCSMEGCWEYHELYKWITMKFLRKMYIIRMLTKRQLKFLGQVMRKESLAILIRTEHSEGEWGRRKQCLTSQMSLCKWLASFRRYIQKWRFI